MKGQSHRPQSSDPADEWVDGSWTVDCFCGVTFDDGEEMIRCDECGVWVHTRCSRYVEGYDTFACDKCKAKHNNSLSATNERLWTDIPMEERVHVQGIPGGDPSPFSVNALHLAKEEGLASMTASNSVTNNAVSFTSAIANSDPSSPLEDQNLSSIRNSPRNISDDDTATAGSPVHRTLPGLINDIMSKGRRMTYEELCKAVLPHWHNLRKHNGEHYSYSSHSQAVLDCLRKRHEWARLVDRGPKTNSNRKRRKLDAEECDDNGYGKGRTAKEVDGKNFELQKEEFPKGKRKARKRRRLARQGRAVEDVRRGDKKLTL